MRRCILFVLFLCLYRLAWGQADYEYRYWFDMDEGTQHSGTFQPGSHSLDVDLSELDASLHFLHFQVKDGDGVWSVPITRRFVKVLPAASSLAYWMDDESQRATLPSLSGHFDIDVSGLSDGLHYLRLQFREASGQGSTPWSGCFLKLPQPDQCTFHYWFDNEQDHARQMEYLGAPALLDVSDLSDGFHRMYIQMEGNASASIPTAHLFVKVPQTDGVSFLTCLCTVDGQLYKVEQVPSEGGIVNWNLEVAALSQGLHNIQVQTLTPSGAATNCSNHFFFRTATREELDGMKLVYSLDGNEFHTMAGDANNGVFHFDVDVAAMEDGLHRLAYHLASDNGTSTKISTAFFIKTPVGGPGIISYSYWLNDREEEACTTTLDKRANPFSLVSLLPVESEPIRSSCFHFELREGQPMMYAKNDFHIAFYDVSGRRVDENRQFVDYNVSQPITNLTPLETTQTFERPDSNCVTWFKFEAEKGDTIAFRSSQATSLQVFSPTGKEIYAVAEDKSVKYGGCHTWEDGTYYVAVHDVTGSKPSVTLDYMHMARYAVVSQDVYTVGNGGASTITFKGNGFDELESIYLEGPETITCDSIYHESNVETSAFFDFTGVATGKYDIHFTFKDDAKVLPANITVEEAKEITFTQQITFAKQYLRSRSNNYQVQITNNGNSTAYDVPVAIYIFTPELNDLNKVWIKEVDVYEQYKKRMPTLFDTDFANHYASVVNNEGYKPLFVTEDIVNYEPGLPAVHKAYINLTLRPNTTEEFNIAINAGTDACVHVWSPDTWETETHPMRVSNKRYKTIIHDTKCNIASIKAQRCEANRMLIANGQEPIYVIDDCPDIKLCPPPRTGGKSTPVASFDPNDIYGYTSESGSRFMTDKVQQMDYRIEFENDTTFASASAHVVVIKDTLNANYFDLNSYSPRSVKIGDREESLDGSPQFVRTIDMRPQINAIAQVEGFYDKIKGIITYRFTSIDPMTMEPTDDVMQGFLPVNYDGKSGIGEVAYDVKLRQSFPDGTEIANKASIIFDNNDPIETPLWVNTIDAVTPAGQVDEVVLRNDTTATIHCVGSDERSGVWKYEVYVQYGSGELWEKVGECPADSAYIDFRVYDSMDYGFCAQAVDSAGNVEAKELAREVSLITYVAGDANGDGVVDIEDVVAAVSYFLDPSSPILFGAANVTKDDRIDIEDVVGISSLYLASTRYARKAVPARMRLREVLSSTQNE